MRVATFAILMISAALFGAAFVGCDRPPAASPAGGPNPITSTEISTDGTADEPGVQVDAPGVQIDVGGDGSNDGVNNGERRRRLRLPNVDVDVNRTPGGAADVDVNVDR
jgi:hypothetical protein